ILRHRVRELGHAELRIGQMPRDGCLQLRHEGAIRLVEWCTNRRGYVAIAVPRLRNVARLLYRRSDDDRRKVDGQRRDEPLAKTPPERDQIPDTRVELTHVERLRQI